MRLMGPMAIAAAWVMIPELACGQFAAWNEGSLTYHEEDGRPTDIVFNDGEMGSSVTLTDKDGMALAENISVDSLTFKAVAHRPVAGVDFEYAMAVDGSDASATFGTHLIIREGEDAEKMGSMSVTFGTEKVDADEEGKATLPLPDYGYGDHEMTVGYEAYGYTFVSDTVVISYPAAPAVTEAVDLGLESGTLWAPYNMGATKETEYGDYFAWGEVRPKEKYVSKTYEHGVVGNETKYNKSDGMTELEESDDVATERWGEEWCMPTQEQAEELFACKHESTSVDGVKGVLFRGENGKTLFIPAAGRWNTKLSFAGSNVYVWCVTLSSSDKSKAVSIQKTGTADASRCNGLSVRAVVKKK